LKSNGFHFHLDFTLILYLYRDPNLVFQMTQPKCKNCCHTGHIAAKCWAKGGSQEGQYPEWHKGNRGTYSSDKDKAVMGTPIVWSYGYASQLDIWFADSAAAVHVSPK